MKELAKKLSELVGQYIKSNDNELIRISRDIENNISELLLESDNLFTTILVTRFFSPIEEYIKKLESIPLGGRSRIELKKQILKRLDLVILFKNKILTIYQEQLKITEHYKENIKEKNIERDFIINPYCQEYPIDIIPFIIFEELLNEACTNTIEYFKNQFDTENIENYKIELFLFVDNTRNKILELDKDINQLTPKIKELEKIKKEFDLLFQYQEDLAKINFHKENLERLLTKLYQSHFILKSYEENRLVPLTVFGSRNYDKINEFYEGLSFFLESSTTLSNIIEVFTLEFIPTSPPFSKINLINGTLNDYAYLITKMQPYFVQEIGDRRKYNQWWTDRFSFNGVEKEKEDIARKRSAIKDDRDVQFRNKINQFVQILENNPQ